MVGLFFVLCGGFKCVFIFKKDEEERILCLLMFSIFLHFTS